MSNSAVSKIMAALYDGYGMQPKMPRRRFVRRPLIPKHHSDQECARRREQLQHLNQVKVDRATKVWVEKPIYLPGQY